MIRRDELWVVIIALVVIAGTLWGFYGEPPRFGGSASAPATPTPIVDVRSTPPP